MILPVNYEVTLAQKLIESLPNPKSWVIKRTSSNSVAIYYKSDHMAKLSLLERFFIALSFVVLSLSGFLLLFFVVAYFLKFYVNGN